MECRFDWRGSVGLRNNRSRVIGTLAAFALLAAMPLSARQEKVVISIKADAGQVARYTSTTSVDIEIGGEKLNLEQKDVTVVTYTAGDANGVTYERKEESSSSKMNGEALPAEETSKMVTTVKLSSKGDVLGYDESEKEEENADLGVRIFSATNVLFSTEPVGPGDKWTIEIEGAEKVGTRKAKADFEYLADETINGTATAKIKSVYAESAGSPPLTAEATSWVEIATGDVVQSEFKVRNVPFSGGGQAMMAQASGTGRRLSGNPLKALVREGEPTTPEETDNIDSKVKEFTKLPGNLPLYHRTKDGRTTIYLEVREDQLGKPMMLQATASTGDSTRVVAGEPLADIVFEFRRMPNEKIFMVVPNYLFRADQNLPIARAVDRSFAESFLESFSVEATQKDRKSILIDVSELFRGDIARISERMAGGGNPLLGGGGASYSMDREKTFVGEMKNFEQNLLVVTTYNFVGGRGGGGIPGLSGPATQPDSRSVVLTINYNLFELPRDNGYVPRMYDRRVGYFTSSFQDFSNDIASDQTKQFIQRWHLVKKNPGEAISEPIEPIVFWLDNAIPTEYRQAVRDGILVWNTAFEKAGFRNAMVVRQMPDDADFDHADMRYNVIRWVASPGSAYAVAQFRTNPLTGQILNASITFDSNFARHLNGEYNVEVEKALAFKWGNDGAASRHVCLNPSQCRYRHEFMAQARVGLLALRLTGLPGQVTESQYINQGLAHVVAHEMGHVLGLRHNFVASTQFTMAQLGNAAAIQGKGTVASVMDYTPFNVGALKKTGIPFYDPTPGVYDLWAIEYGYMVTGKSTKAEIPQLMRHASQTNTPGLAYNSDEFADSVDPYVTRFDLSKEPIEYWTRIGSLSRYLIMNLEKTTPKAGESYWIFTKDFQTLVGSYVESSLQVSRYLAGVRINANFKGDPGQKPNMQTLSPADQKAALLHLNTYVFAPNAFEFPKHYYGKLTANPNLTLEELQLSINTFPVRDQFASFQAMVLNRVFSTSVMAGLANQEFKAQRSQDALTLATVFKTVGPLIWAELGDGKETPALRRQLQSAHLDKMMLFALRPPAGTPVDARVLAWNELTRLRTALRASLKKVKGDYTPAHQREALMRIDRAFSAVESLGSGGAAPSQSLLEMLLGGRKGG